MDKVKKDIIIIETKDKDDPDKAYFEAILKSSDMANKELLEKPRIDPLYYFD